MLNAYAIICYLFILVNSQNLHLFLAILVYFWMASLYLKQAEEGKCIGVSVYFMLQPNEGKCIDIVMASFHLKHSGGQMYRCSDGLSFILNIQEGKCIDLAMASLSS